ncbi:MAG: hypothetical protein DRJ98_08140 [Thermoprotei archaeon]|nr:MAG: hypothetical protein DRJ98_08140 [Thermoprotei archaeon]
MVSISRPPLRRTRGGTKVRCVHGTRKLDGNLPAALEKPIEPKRGMGAVMVGWKSGPKTGVMLDDGYILRIKVEELSASLDIVSMIDCRGSTPLA